VRRPRQEAERGAARTLVTAAGCVAVLAGAVGLDPSLGVGGLAFTFLVLVLEGSR
jgi:hypothetical protein